MKPQVGSSVHFFYRIGAEPEAAIVVGFDYDKDAPSLVVFSHTGVPQFYHAVPQATGGPGVGFFWDWPAMPLSPSSTIVFSERKEDANEILDTPIGHFDGEVEVSRAEPITVAGAFVNTVTDPANASDPKVIPFPVATADVFSPDPNDRPAA